MEFVKPVTKLDWDQFSEDDLRGFLAEYDDYHRDGGPNESFPHEKLVEMISFRFHGDAAEALVHIDAWMRASGRL